MTTATSLSISSLTPYETEDKIESIAPRFLHVKIALKCPPYTYTNLPLLPNLLL